MTFSAHQATGQAPRKHLLLVGAGHAHLHALHMLARHRPAHLTVTLLTPDAWQTYSGMVPGYVAGQYAMDACRIALQPLLRDAGVMWIQGLCTGIDAAQSQVTLQRTGGGQQDLQTLHYDLLSLDTGAVFDPLRLAADMPGALEHTLPVRPIDDFTERWQAMVGQRQPLQDPQNQNPPQPLPNLQPCANVSTPRAPEQSSQPAHHPHTTTWAFIGAGAASVELLMAAHQRFWAAPQRPGGSSSQTQLVLVTGGNDVAAGYAPGIQRRVLRQLAQRNVQVVRQRCVGAQPGALRLEDGSLLPCDGAVLAVGTHAPRWLQGSGLALADTGHLRVNRFQQSTSHTNVFAAGDVATRADAAHPKSGVYAVRAGPPLAHNLLAAAIGRPLKPYQPPTRTLNLLSCGTGHAILSWGPLHAEGAWAWWLKDRIDRAFVARYAPQG